MSLIKISWKNSQNETEKGEKTFSIPVHIGRGAQNDLVLATESAGVSRFHALLEVTADGMVLNDLNSTNGTWINGLRIHNRAKYNGYDQNLIVIGAYLLMIKKQVICHKESCAKVIDHDIHICPWCGQFTADALTKQLTI